MILFRKYIFLILLMSLFQPAQAIMLCHDVLLKKPMFGLEFTFTNNEIIQEANTLTDVSDTSGLFDYKVKPKYWKKLSDLIKAKCIASGDCFMGMTMDKHDVAFLVRFKDGFNFSVGSDSKVLEANAQPNTLLSYKLVLDRLDKYLFQSAREVGLEPHHKLGGGHIHISRRAFKENSLAFRNFFVDFQNRPEIALGVFGQSYENAPMLSVLKQSQRTAFEKALISFKNAKNMSIDQFVKLINTKVYTQSFRPEWGSPTHYQALNLNRMAWEDQLATLEIRSFRPQKSVEIFYKQIQLLSRWIEKMQEVQYEIPYLGLKTQKEYTDAEKRMAFEKLLKSLDLSMEDYGVLLE